MPRDRKREKRIREVKSLRSFPSPLTRSVAEAMGRKRPSFSSLGEKGGRGARKKIRLKIKGSPPV